MYLRHLIRLSSPRNGVSFCTESYIEIQAVTKHVNQAGSEVGQWPDRDIEIRARIGYTRGTKGEFAPAVIQIVHSELHIYIYIYIYMLA